MAKMKYGTHPGYEATDAAFAPIVKFAFWLAVFTAVALVSMYGLLMALKEIPHVEATSEAHPLTTQDSPFPPGPHLESFRGIMWDDHGRLIVKAGSDGKIDYKAASNQYAQKPSLEESSPFNNYMWPTFGPEMQQHLQGYGWVDRQAGVANIPVERAQELVLKKGLPTSTKPKE
jgi:hypothetical protein